MILVYLNDYWQIFDKLVIKILKKCVRFLKCDHFFGNYKKHIYIYKIKFLDKFQKTINIKNVCDILFILTLTSGNDP